MDHNLIQALAKVSDLKEYSKQVHPDDERLNRLLWEIEGHLKTQFSEDYSRIKDESEDCELLYSSTGSGNIEFLQERIAEIETQYEKQDAEGVDYQIELYDCDFYE